MESILTSIDVGTSKICTMVVKMNGGRIAELLGAGIVPSHGIHKAIVLDIDEPTAAIRESVREAERSSGTEVREAYIGITGHHIGSVNHRGTVSISRRDHRVTKRELDRAARASRDIPLSKDKKIIHAIPRRYYLDGEAILGSPVGLHGYKLDVESHLVTAGVTFIQNLVKCVQGAGVDVKDLVLESLASGEAVLDDSEKDGGVVLADMGAGTTDVTVFKGRAIWHSRALPVGGYNVTKDIAIGLGVPFNMAEELKVKYGTVAEGGKVPNVINLDREGRHTITSQDLSFIIKARLDEIIRMVFSGLPRAEWDAWEPTRLVLCGGSANLPGIAALGEEILSQPVRVGKPKGLPSRTEILDNPAYATGVGLLLWGAKYGNSVAPSVDGLLNRFFAQFLRLRASLPRIFGFGG